uniref:Uncharacterized protein n=1 Tax=Peronospora matthiolae TaxID=2874970 RepID=A0AAV1UAS8_9STRA
MSAHWANPRRFLFARKKETEKPTWRMRHKID